SQPPCQAEHICKSLRPKGLILRSRLVDAAAPQHVASLRHIALTRALDHDFTSSCPPADRLVPRLRRVARSVHRARFGRDPTARSVSESTTGVLCTPSHVCQPPGVPPPNPSSTASCAAAASTRNRRKNGPPRQA